MSDVNTFAPQSPSPWGHLNEATNPEALEDPNEQPAQVNHQSFTDWNVDNASGDELQDLKGYADYVRQEYVDKDQATVGFEQDLRQLVYSSAFQKGLLNEEDGDEVNNQKLFGAPEFSVESSIKLISESSSSSVAAIAANNLSALPEGTDPDQVWDDIITYKAKQQAFANSMATEPEATSKNQEIKDDLAFWKERAEGYANSGIYDRAAKDALLDGRVAATRIFKDDGSSYVQIGKGAEGMSVKDIIASSKDYGVTLQDAASISKQLETPEGFRHTTADIMRKQEIGAIFDGILEADNVAPAPVESGSRVANTAADVATIVGTSLVGQGSVVGAKMAAEYIRPSNNGSRGEASVVQRRTATQQFDKFTRLYNAYDESLGEDDAANTERLKKLLDAQTLSIYTNVSESDPTLANMDMELDEFQTVLTQRAGDVLLGGGKFKLQDDPDKMGLNIKTYGYGPAQMHRSLVSNVTKFEESLAANKGLTDSDREQLRTNREAMSAQNFDSANELLSKGANAEEWLGTLQEGRANGKKDHIVLEEFISDPENYSELEARARGVGAAWGQGFVSMVTAPLAMAGNEWARESLIEASRENAARRERARLFGVEFGIGQDVFETIGPVFADMAVTAALTATTGAGGVMFLAAKQGAKLSAKSVTKGIVKSMTLNSPFKKLVVEGVEESSENALKRLVKDGYILEPATDEIKKGAMGAIDQFGKIASNKWTQEVALNVPAFSRSAGASYAATYDTLTQLNPDMSHEEKHDRAFGSGIVAGFSTIAIMKGFRSIGRGGIEDAFIKGMTKREAVGVMQRLGGKGAAKLGSKDAEKVWAHMVGKIQKDMTKGVGKFAGQKNIVMEAFDGFTSEALEEGLDEFVNSYISDYYTDQNTDGMARLESVYRAALTGGFIGSGMGAYQKLGNRLSTREQSKIEQRRLENTFVTSVTSELENTGSRVSAEVVRGILTGKARGAKAAEQRAELTSALDPNFVPEDRAAAPETTAEGAAAAAPFTPAPLKGQVEELNKLKEERASLQAAGEEQTFLDGEQLERANEVEARIAELETLVNNVTGQDSAAQPAATAAPVEPDTSPVEPNPQTVGNKYEHNSKMVKTMPSQSVFQNPEADSAGLSEEQQDQIDLAFEENLTPEQQALFEELDTFDITGTVRQLRILEAIQAGTLTKDGDEIIGMPEVVEPELSEQERRQVMVDLIAENEEGFIVGRLDQETADAEAMRGTEADYTVDEQNYIIGVRDPETNEWSGKVPLQSVAADRAANMDETTSPETVSAALEEERQEQAEKQALEGKAVVDTTTITETLSPEEAKSVTEELELDDERTIRGANLDTLAPVTPEQVDAAAEQGVDLVEVQEQMLLDIDKEGRVVESEEDQDIPMSAGQAEVDQATAEGPSFVNTPEDEVAFEALVASGFPSRVTSKTKSGFKVTKKPKGYYPTVSTEAARQIYETHPVTPLAKPEGGKVFEGRKQVHYNPHAKKMSSSKGAPVKGFLDASGRGVFDNDPVLTAEYLKAGKVVIVPEGVTVNPSILMDPDTRRVLRVVSVNNNNEGLLQDGGDPDKVISTQANHAVVLSKSAAAGLFERRFYNTPLEIAEAPQANGTTEAVEEGKVFTVGDFINNVTTFIENAMSANSEGSVFGSLKKLLNPNGVAPLEGDYFDAGAQRFMAETILVANAYVARKNILDGPLKKLLTLKLGKDGKVAVGPKGKPTGEYVLKSNTATNRSKLIRAFISQTRLDGLPAAESTKQLAEVATSSGRNFSESAANFILKEIVNHPNLRENTMPPMTFIASLATDNFRKQQKARVKVELQRDAESSQYTEGDVPAASAPDTSLESVSTEPLNRDALNDAIDQDDNLVQSILADPETPEVRNVLVELAVQFSNGNQQVVDLVAGMSTNRIYSEVSVILQQNPNSSKLNTIMAKLEETNPTLHSMLRGGYGVARTGTPKQNKDHNTVTRNATKRLWSRSRIAEANRKVARAANLAEAERLGLVSGDADSVVAALQKISETGTPAHKLVANLLLENESLVRDVNFNIISANLPFAGMQATMTDGSLQVTLNLEGHNGRGLTNVLLEEYVHATLTKVLSKPRSSLTPAQLAAVTRLESLRNEVAEAATAAGYRNNSAIMDSLVNLDEFVAGIMLSPELQLEIKGLGADSGGKPFFRKIMDAVLDFFGKGVTAKEASTYADALADVIDLSRSTVKLSDPRMKTRAKRVAAEATATIKATSDAFKATGLPAVSSSQEVEQDQSDAELTADEILEREAAENLDDIVGQLTDRDTGSEGTVSPTERSADQAKAESLLQVARELIPPEVPLRIDRTINAAAEFKNGEVLINPAYLMELTQDLGIISSKMIVAKVMSHELSHVASFNALTQEEIDELANTIPNYMFEEIIDNYYSDRPAEAAAARELLLASELDEQGQADLLDLKARLTEEHLRMRMEKLTSGYTTEQDWAFYRTNPSTMKILFRYVSGYFRRMAEMRRFASDLDNGSPNRFMDSAVNKLIHELRSIKAGYRLQESSIAFDPTRPDQGLAVLADKMEEGLTSDPEDFLNRTDGLQAAIALPKDYMAKVSEEYDAARVGTAKIGTKKKPRETTQVSNITQEMVPDDIVAKQMAKITYSHLPASVLNKRNPQAKQTAFVDWMVQNLIHLHNQFPQDLRARATHWYDGARILADNFADKYSYQAEQVAGVMAALSPQKDWFMNVAQADQLIDIFTNHQNTRLSRGRVGATMDSILEAAQAPAKQKKKAPKGTTESTAAKTKRLAFNNKLDQDARAERAAIFSEIEGKTLSELQSNETAHGWAIRILAQTIHGRDYKAISPEGELGHIILKKNSIEPAKNGWGSVSEIVKAVHILRGDSISDNLGEMHKVRNFYNNIIAPNSPYGDVTIDTHAVAAAHLLPFGASAIEVKHNFGSPMGGAPAQGINGSYHMYADAYRQAAAALGIQPRQLQSITWESIRMVHPPETRRDKIYIAAQKKLWENKDDEQARQNLTANRDFTPAWAGFGSDSRASEIPAGLREDGDQDGPRGSVPVRDGGRQSRRRNPNVGLQSAIGREDQGVTEYDEQFMDEAEMSGQMYAFVEDMPYSVRKALERNDYLGYSSASEALANIASEQDWELGTDLNTPSDQGIINRYINKLYGQTAEDVSWRRRTYGLQSAIAPSKGFDPDQMNYAGFIDQLELPFYATGGYSAPTSLVGRLLRGALDPRIERFIQNRQFFLNAAEKTAQSFKAKFDKQLKEAYPDGLDASDTANLNAALGGSAIVPEARRKEIEKEYQAELDTIAQTVYETAKARKLDEQIAKDNKFGKILAEKQVKAKAIREAQTAALAQLDAVSPELAETIQGIRSQLIEPIQEKMKDLYDMSEDVRAHFDVQKGIYLTTQYRMFTETGFYEHAKSSPEFAGIREEAVKYFMEQRKVTRLEELREAASANNVIFNDQEAQLVIEAEFGEQSENLQTLGQMDMDAFLAKYRRAGKNDVVSDNDAKIIEDNLKEKRDLDPRLKALLGEVGNDGTVDSIIRTFLTVSKMAANQAMYQNIKKMGRREGFLMTAEQLKEARKLDPDTYADWDVLSTKTTSDHNPLRGMYAAADVRDGLQGMFKSEINTETDTDSEKVVGAVTSVLRKASGWSMATKTLGSVGFYIRNMLSNMLFFGPSQGFINVFAMGAKTKYVWDELKDPTRMDAYLSELSALGVIDNEIRSTMMEEMLNGTRNLSDVINEQNKVIQGAAKATEATFGKAYAVATRMAGAVDGFYKIAYYENELKVLRKAKARADQEGGSFANYSDADLKQMARDKVLMTAQSASQAPPVVKEVAGHGIGALVAPFIRFKAEVPRVVFNTFKLAREEIGSDSSVIKARGYQRMAGMMSVGVGASGFGAAILAMLSGTDDEDMQDFQRETAPSYLRSHSFWGVPRWLSKKFGAGDKYQTVDLTYINPYALLADPIVRSYEKMMKGDLAGAGAALVNGLITDQYLDTQIAAGALSAVIENRDPTTNKPIVEDVSDTSGEAAVKRLTFLFNEAYAPDVLKRAVKAYQTGTSEEKYTDPENTVNNILFGALRPFKVHTIDPERQLTNYLYQSRREFANVKARKNAVRSTKPMTEKGIIQLIIEEQEDRAAIINHNIRMARGAKKYGMTDKHVFQTLSQALTKRRAQNTMNGVMDRIVLTPDFTKSLIQNAKSEEEKKMKLARVKNMFKQIGKMPLKQRLSEGPVRDR